MGLMSGIAKGARARTKAKEEMGPNPLGGQDLAPFTAVYLAFNAGIRAHMKSRWDSLRAGTGKLPPPSDEGAKILRQVLYGTGHTEGNAYAGTGKTTLAMQTLWHGQETGRLATLDIHTYHSYGLSVIRQSCGRSVFVKEDKYKYWLKDHKKVAKWKTISTITKLVGLCKSSMLAGTIDDVLMLEDKYEVEIPNVDRTEVLSLVGETMAYSKEINGLIDYDDMCWLPAVYGWVPKVVPGLLLVDEAQDTSPVQLYFPELVSRMGGKVMSIGDRCQAIYEWRGAGAEAMDVLGKIIGGVTSLPLSVTYRCPKRIVASVQRLLYELSGGKDWAKAKLDPAKYGLYRSAKDEEGVIGWCKEDWFYKDVQVGDLVMCRTNAPLMSTALRLVRDRKPCQIKGKEFGQALVRLVDTICQLGQREGLPDLPAAMLRYQQVELDKLSKEDIHEQRVASLIEKMDCLMALYYGVFDGVEVAPGHIDVAARRLVSELDGLFNDKDPSNLVLLSSVHRAKGLEANRTWILRPDLLPRTAPRKKGRKLLDKPVSKQEYHLAYVAITRALEQCVFVAYGDCQYSSVVDTDAVEMIEIGKEVPSTA